MLSKLSLTLLLGCLAISACSKNNTAVINSNNSNVVAVNSNNSSNINSNTFSMKDIEGKDTLAAIEKIAMTDPTNEDLRGEEIKTVLSKVNNPKLLYGYFVEFRKRTLEGGKYVDGIGCISCDRYDIATYITLERFSEIGTDEAAKYLVMIVEKGIVSGHAHLTEELVHNIAVIGKPALPYLKKIKGEHEGLAKIAIGCIEQESPCH